MVDGEAAMKRSILLLVSLMLASCQTTTPSTTTAAAFATFPVTCPWRATFPVPVEFADESNRPDLPTGTKRLVVRGKGSLHQYGITCFCNDRFNFSRVTQRDAEALNDGALKPEIWSRENGNFKEIGSRKEYEYSAKLENFMGVLIRKGRSHYQGHCGTTVEAMAPASDIASVDNFIRSIWDVRDVATAPASPAAPNSSIESRLSTIKDLLDRKVITQQEYDERRRAILGSL